MPLLGAVIKQGLKLSSQIRLRFRSPAYYQKKELRNLMKKAENTAFGKKFNFSSILASPDPVSEFQDNVPIYNYNSIFEEWWHRCLAEEKDVCWPGHVKYFALSSGTSEAASKHIPVTSEMVKSLRKASIRQIITLGKYDLPASTFEKGILWLGGSTDLKRHGGYYEGDVSGISARRTPIWFQKYYKPGKKISKEKDWNIKLEEITKEAHKWDIGIITGVPSWVQLLMEKIIAHYKLKTIHDIWPNLRVYAHGGVSFEPYRKGFDRFFSEKVHFIEMYPASEGFFAFQYEPNVHYMKLIVDNGIFYEFIPFNDENFDSAGEVRPTAKAVTIEKAENNKDYALLLSTCAGAWRYMIGDVIRFVDVEHANIIISGRTKHFLSLVGEHLSVDNMNKAIEHLSQVLDIEIPEYMVTGIPYEGTFAHQWYLGTNKAFDVDKARKILDDKLKEVNDDYAVERISALKDVFVQAVPSEYFYEFMTQKGKMGGQNKFPRVMKSTQAEEWKSFLAGKI
ncbi:MAG: GH3 auxin-responsive promoter family protein [Bacteroidetes bacterium]|nr:GH3 auxin-responsive promoter family protein [Bacteroidota bacterium]